ncbi:MAG: lysophospholipid acyltransferase family protein [Kiritimatiellae bacterium]|nr:lysophospholipid acyltransferase family protein [Kiritimatiellia bacterium]
MKKSRTAINLEYCALRGACAIVNAIPYPVAMWMARLAAKIAVRIFKFKRERTFARIEQVFPGSDKARKLEIAEFSLFNVLANGLEMVRAPKLSRKWMDRHVVDGAEYKDKLQHYVDEGKGVVIMVPHSGNWYMAAWSMAKYGLPLFAIAARQRNPKIDAWMTRQYGDIEVLCRSERGTLNRIKDYLQGGRAFAILPDLRVPTPDTEVEFLGHKANVSHAACMFAVKCGSPVVVAAMSRKGGKHVYNHLATLRPEGKTAQELTQEAMKILSDHVMAHPEEWFWYNKRWILEPVSK